MSVLLERLVVTGGRTGIEHFLSARGYVQQSRDDSGLSKRAGKARRGGEWRSAHGLLLLKIPIWIRDS